MASEQWLLNDTSVAGGSYWTAVGSSYKLKNITGSTVSRTTSTPTPYEGAGCYRPISGLDLIQFFNSSNAALTGGTYYFDTYFFSRVGDGGYLLNTGNDTNVEYTGVYVDSYGYFYIATYDPVNGLVTQAVSGADIPFGAWCRMQVKATAAGITEARLFKGTGIDGTSPAVTLTYTPGYTSFERLYGGGGNSYDTAYPAYDNIKFDDAAYPTRSTAHTASGTSTITATGTAAMSNARVGAGTGTGTATGTGAASRGQSVTGSASVTASGTAAMSSTQAMSASATATATGTAAGAITAVVTISGSATATASATAGASSTQVFAGSATITGTGAADSSIRPLVTVDGVGTITATGASTASKQQTLAATASATATATGTMIFITQITASATVTATATALALITTPGTLYGNAEKVAGLYGSSTKPTLTTRS